MSDEPSGSGRDAPSSLPPPPTVKAPGDDDADLRRANARAVGVDTAFLDALGDEFADAPAPAGRYGKGGTLVVEGKPKPAPATTT
ncbi:MAG: hypothetical protein AAF721_10280, partial [Myxococcota bacterium]